MISYFLFYTFSIRDLFAKKLFVRSLPIIVEKSCQLGNAFELRLLKATAASTSTQRRNQFNKKLVNHL